MELTNLNMSDEELLEINGGWDFDEATVQRAKWTMAIITVSGQKIYDTAQGFAHGVSDGYNH